MKKSILSFNSKTQEFALNLPEFDKLNFRKMSQELFDKAASSH